MLLIIFFTFFYKSIIFLDPDFGWHLKMGEIISHFGIPQTDPFSYSASNYPYIDHSWFSDFLIYKIYSFGGIIALSLIFSLTVLVALSISASLFKQKLPSKNIFIFLLSAAIFPYFGVRTQIISWLFLPMLILLLQKNKFLIPFLIFLWVNLHGSFALGLVIIFIFFVSKSASQKKLAKDYLLIFFLSIIATFANPYGSRIYLEVENTSGNFLLRSNIQEWAPGIFFLSPAILSILVISFMFIIKFHFRFSLFEKLLYLTLLFEFLSANRHIPLFAIIALPIIIKGLNSLKLESKKTKLGPQRFNYFYKALSFAVIISTFSVYFSQLHSVNLYSQEVFYPKNAVEFLSEYPQKGEVFSQYGWGGYLIWQLPQKKVFIDGRMPSWKSSNINIFKNYLDIANGSQNFEEVAQKYNIHTVLWTSPSQKQNSDLYSTFMFYIKKYITKNYSDFNFLEYLQQNGWQEIYKDETAIILTK